MNPENRELWENRVDRYGQSRNSLTISHALGTEEMTKCSQAACLGFYLVFRTSQVMSQMHNIVDPIMHYITYFSSYLPEYKKYEKS